MKPYFETENYLNGKLIKLSSSLKTRAKVFNLVYAIFFLASAASCSFILVTQWEKSMVGDFIISLGTVGFAIAFFRLINKATETEKLFVNENRFGIIRQTLFTEDIQSFEIGEMSDLKFNDQEKFEAHPLKGESFDYFGFQTEQKVIENLHSEGRASFLCRGKMIRFGKELASWDFNELEVLLYELTGNDFRYTNKFKLEYFQEGE